MFMKFIPPPPNKFGKGLIVGFLSAAILFSSAPVTAAVSDNSGGFVAKLASFLGFGKESSTPSDSEFDSASLVEKVNYLEDEIEATKNQTISNTASINNRINAAKTEIIATVKDASVTANAKYNLFVYLPKTDALGNYVNTEVKLLSPTGNQTSSIGKFTANGSNYEANLYFDFSGNCKLVYDFILANGSKYSTYQMVTISDASQEFRIPAMTGSVSSMKFDSIAAIVRAGLSSSFGLTTAGTALYDGWYVIGSDTSASVPYLTLWKKQTIGSGNYPTCVNLAGAYSGKFNTNYGLNSVAYESSILDYGTLTSGWFGDTSNGYYNCRVGTEYWTSSVQYDYGDWYDDNMGYICARKYIGSWGPGGDSGLWENGTAACVPYVKIH